MTPTSGAMTAAPIKLHVRPVRNSFDIVESGAVECVRRSPRRCRGRLSVDLVELACCAGLMVAGGAAPCGRACPVTSGAWRAQKADAIVFELRTCRANGRLANVEAGLPRSTARWRPIRVADRYLQRSELMGGAALTMDLKATQNQREEWMRAAPAPDLESGLAGAPARGIDDGCGWRCMRQALDGTSRDVVLPLSSGRSRLRRASRRSGRRGCASSSTAWVYFSDAEQPAAAATMSP